MDWKDKRRVGGGNILNNFLTRGVMMAYKLTVERVILCQRLIGDWKMYITENST